MTKQTFSCSSCGYSWDGKSISERKTAPRCPQCSSRTILPMEQLNGNIDLELDSGLEPPKDDFQEFVLEPIEFDVEFQRIREPKKRKPQYTKKQLDQLVKASRSSMRELCGMGYTGLVMIINFIFKTQLPPPMEDEINRFAEAWLSITRSHRTFGKSMQKIPILGLIAIHFDFFIRRRQFFKPPKPKETKHLKDTDPEPPQVVETHGSPFTARLKERHKK